MEKYKKLHENQFEKKQHSQQEITEKINKLTLETMNADQNFVRSIEKLYISQLQEWTGKKQYVFVSTLVSEQFDIKTFNQLIEGMGNIMFLFTTKDNYVFGVYDESIIPSPPVNGFITTKKNRKHFIFSLENKKRKEFKIERNSSFLPFQSKDFYRIYSNSEEMQIFGIDNFMTLQNNGGLFYRSNTFSNVYNTSSYSLTDIYPRERFDLKYLVIIKWI